MLLGCAFEFVGLDYFYSFYAVNSSETLIFRVFQALVLRRNYHLYYQDKEEIFSEVLIANAETLAR